MHAPDGAGAASIGSHVARPVHPPLPAITRGPPEGALRKRGHPQSQRFSGTNGSGDHLVPTVGHGEVANRREASRHQQPPAQQRRLMQTPSSGKKPPFRPPSRNPSRQSTGTLSEYASFLEKHHRYYERVRSTFPTARGEAVDRHAHCRPKAGDRPPWDASTRITREKSGLEFKFGRSNNSRPSDVAEEGRAAGEANGSVVEQLLEWVINTVWPTLSTLATVATLIWLHVDV